mgnify:CR=1 FL=1
METRLHPLLDLLTVKAGDVQSLLTAFVLHPLH